MRISAGLGSLDDLKAYVQAGADEVFVGYIPGWWIRKYGMHMPLNRREVMYYNVQIGSYSEMEILSGLAEAYGAKVTVTLNALYYLPEQYPELLKYIRECMTLGFTSFIIADYALLLYLRKQEFYKDLSVSASGEIGEMNRALALHLAELGIRRLIFHRKMTISEMAECVVDGIEEYEAFALNENCHFHGGYCSSLHCDELAHSCHLPCKLVRKDGSIVEMSRKESREEYLTGNGGCALCALWDLAEAGITHLKVVGRGNDPDWMEMDISSMKKALHILERAESREAYIAEMKKELFPNGCSECCYYRDDVSW